MTTNYIIMQGFWFQFCHF